MHAASTGDQPDPRFGQCEDCVLRGDDNVASEGDFESATHRHAVDRGDEWLVQVKPAAKPGEAVWTNRSPLAAGLNLQVVAGRKRAAPCPGYDSDPKVVALGEFVPGR